jgi:hypothetical protein
VRGDINDYRVAILYEKGPEAPGSWHPRGYIRVQLKDKLIQIWLLVEELGVSDVMRLLIIQSAWGLTFFIGGPWEQTLERRPAWQERETARWVREKAIRNA